MTTLAWSRLGDVCVTDGCSSGQYRRQMCNSCYKRWLTSTPASERPRPTTRERFEAKVERREADDCWPWRGSLHEAGYGRFYVSMERGSVPAHTFAVELATGLPCPPGKEGCHHCDNPPCCNPEHVYYGTRQQNVDNSGARGRRPVGEQRYNARLTRTTVVAIRDRYAAGARPQDLAAEYRVHPSTIWSAVRGESWKQAGGPIDSARGASRRRNVERQSA